MKMKNILLAVAVGLWTTAAIAHSPLKATTPADKSIVAEMPLEVVLNFKNTIRLTRVAMTNADKPGIVLDLEGNKKFLSEHRIPVPPLGSGSYVIEWRGLGADGHALKGSFDFSVK
jgi:methionine-rich copper-binding protein CopC